VADIDATLKQQILDLAQRQRITNLHHHRQADDLGWRIERAERNGFFIRRKLRTTLLRINPVCFDKANPAADPRRILSDLECTPTFLHSLDQ